jgi:asparagine synthase (glutamine-hydrolysing)
MCGIFAILNLYDISYNSIVNINNINDEFMKGQKRGPEFSKLDTFKNNVILGFHRLAINGLNSNSNQPINVDDIILICNGEIYNFKQIYRLLNITPKTDSDCEAIIHLYKRYGIEQTLIMLDGVYGFILYDVKVGKIFVARDPIGVRPLYYLHNNTNPFTAFASELKSLAYFQNLWFNENYKIQHIVPGSYSVYTYSDEIWKNEIQDKPYYLGAFPHTMIIDDISICKENYYNTISKLLYGSVMKRCETTEREVACLLSGGLDSSLIAALVADYFRNEGKTIETYSIGLAGSEDVKHARIVADYIGSKHNEIIVTEDDMFNAIREVIQALESYDTTTIRASLGNYLVSKYISQNSKAKVVFNGDGSDELLGGYLYMNKCPDEIEFDMETRRLLKDIHLFDVLRSDKSISSNGLEPRTPFLDKTFVNYILSIPAYFRNHNNFKECEKYLLRNAFTESHYKDSLGRQLLPNEILWRRKEAFSDGVTSHGRSLFQILQEKIGLKLNMEPNIETEKLYYKQIFDELYPNCSHILPYFWMPKYTNATDPSARTLTIY